MKNFGVYGDVSANGTISRNGGMMTGKLSHNASTASPINFAAEHSYLTSTSLALAQMTANGTTTVTPWHAISLTGMEDINIFNLDGNALSHASSLTLNIGADDIAIVNVSGTLDDFSGFGIFGYQGHQEDIIYNFYEADQLTINNIAIQGSILAPDADVIFNSGVINGTLIADSLTGTGQSNQSLFDHDIPLTSVPEPGTAILFGTGLVGIFIFRKKIKRSGILLQEDYRPVRTQADSPGRTRC